MNAASRGSISLLGESVVGSYEYFSGEAGRDEQTVTDLLDELRSRYGAHLEVPPYHLSAPNGVIGSHHLGGGIGDLGDGGRVSGYENVFLGDMCAAQNVQMRAHGSTLPTIT